jgi:hypothetical protein
MTFLLMHSSPAKACAIAAIILLAYIALSTGTAHALRPWIDEGWHGAPAWSLAFRGYMGTPCFVDPALKDIGRYTYWIMPIYPVLQALWYRVVGFSLGSMRALSILCGLLGLLCWASVYRRLTEDTYGALLFMALMACDYVNLTDAGTGRPDMMALAFQAGAFAAYLHWRDKHFGTAVLISQSLVVASGLSHPNGGVLSFLGVLWLVSHFDRQRVRASHFALAVVPYVVGAIGWGAYIAQDPSAFVSQYGYQLGSRTLASPWVMLRDELVRRYLTMMGLRAHSVGSYGPHFLKAFVFVAYAISVVGLLGIRALRLKPATRVLLGMIAIDFLFFTFLEGTKAAYYLIYLVYPLTAATALFVRGCWLSYPRCRSILALGVVGLFVIQIGGAVYRIRRDAYHREYLPAVAFLRAHAKPGDLIVGSHELGFSIGFNENFVDDHLLGLNTGKWPDFIFLEEIYQLRFDTVKLKEPALYRELCERLAQYQVIYERNFYQILGRRGGRQVTMAVAP